MFVPDTDLADAGSSAAAVRHVERRVGAYVERMGAHRVKGGALVSSRSLYDKGYHYDVFFDSSTWTGRGGPSKGLRALMVPLDLLQDVLGRP